MNTKEYVRVELDASACAVRDWLEDMAADAELIGECTFGVVSLELHPDAAGHPQEHRRRYGIFDGRGVQVLDAAMRSHTSTTDITELEIRRDETFPLVMEQLIRLLDERFPGVRGDMLAQKRCGKTGAPPLACNVWLEEQLRSLPEPEKYHHLYSAWLAHYVILRGYEPQDPRRSFRAAARGCLRRIRKQSMN